MAPVTSSASSGQAASIALKVVAYAPQNVKAAEGFNVQVSGQSALWIKVDHSVAGSPAAIWWDDRPLDSSVNGDVVSALVPASLYAAPGVYSLQVRLGTDGQGQRSNVVQLTVK